MNFLNILYGRIVCDYSVYQTVVDAVADYLICKYYDKFGKPQNMSILQYQEAMTDVVHYIKNQACDDGRNVLPAAACSSDRISEFLDNANTHIIASIGEDDNEYVVVRKGYSSEDIAQCIGTKYRSTYRDYYMLVNRIESFISNNARPFLELLKSRGFSPHHILDVGANIGEYATSISHLFPGTDVFMIEAGEEHEPFLQRMSDESTRYRYEIAAVMNVNKNMTFYKEIAKNDSIHHQKATGNSLFRENTPYFENIMTTTVETKTIDSIMASRNISNIDFIKMDIQGAELYALKGATNTLKNIDVIQLEIHISNLNSDAPTFFELHQYMESLGFGIRDQGQTFRVVKPYEMLVGMDFYWVRKCSKFWKRQS